MIVSPALLNKLSRAKLLTRWAVASVGVGERRSRTKGAGMEFAEHREYQPGDDLRYLDPHLYARFGAHYIRQYEVYQQLPITILLDASRSMNFGHPNKFDYARSLAALFGFVGLAGGDQVQIGVGAGRRLHWSVRYHGAQRAQRMFAWLGERTVENEGDFGATLRSATRNLSGRGLLIILSDWWEDDIEAELALLVATGQEVWGLQVVSPEELDPTMLGRGEVRLVDIESGHEVELAIDRASIDRYERAVAAWRAQIQAVLSRSHGRYLLAPTDGNVEKLFVEEWRARGMIG
ncbi:MAG: DUF58 domain-containing protein [Bauldia sp.]|nr:DUF58 domain-containing protein [Bauldia sp.]